MTHERKTGDQAANHLNSARQETGKLPNKDVDMTQTLSPVGPPTGHRRARRYAAEMVELRRQGYTFEAIREALAGAGIDVCNNTVQREVARYERLLRPTGAVSADPKGEPYSPSA